MKSATQIDAQAADWIARRDGYSWSDEQQLQLDQWLDEATAHRVAYLRLRSTWSRADRLSSLHVPGKISVPLKTVRHPRFSIWRVAASILIATTLGSLIATGIVLNGSRSYSTALGESKAVALADGTHLVLNTDTQVRTRIADGTRTVWLDSGEAYFEVAHDPRHPFVVEAGDSRITVLGTKFSVRRDADHVDVVVVDGRVQVSEVGSGAQAGTTVVTKNDVVVASRDQMVVTKKTAEQVLDQLGWRQGKLVLDQMTLKQAAIEFNRYNRKKLVIDDPAVENIRIGGSFNVDNVEGFAHLLHEGFGVKVEEADDEIKIVGRTVTDRE
jgi:transmembrane sensor